MPFLYDGVFAVKIFAHDDAVLANLIIVLIRYGWAQELDVNRSWLIEEVNKHSARYHTPARIIMILVRLFEYQVVHSQAVARYDYFQATDLSYNLENSPELRTWQCLPIFATIHAQQHPTKKTSQYELLVYDHEDFSDTFRWAESVDKIQRDPKWETVGADIITEAIRILQERRLAHPAENLLAVDMVELIPTLQLSLFSKHPLLSPLVIQAFVEHAAVQRCLSIGAIICTSSHTTKVFNVIANLKEPEEVEALVLPTIKALQLA